MIQPGQPVHLAFAAPCVGVIADLARVIGCALAMYINNIIGRKRTIVLTGLISIVGIVIEMTSAVGSHARFGQFVAGKVINSIAMGLAANVVPIYLSETSVSSARGFVINMYQSIQIIGVIVAAGCVYAVSTRTDRSAYLIPMGVQAIAPGLILLVTPLLVESPRWLVWVGRHEEAIMAANALFATETNGFDAADYCGKLAIAFEEEHKAEGGSGWADVFRMPDLRRMLIAIGIQALQQAQGSSYMNSYVVSFLQGEWRQAFPHYSFCSSVADHQNHPLLSFFPIPIPHFSSSIFIRVHLSDHA